MKFLGLNLQDENIALIESTSPLMKEEKERTVSFIESRKTIQNRNRNKK